MIGVNIHLELHHEIVEQAMQLNSRVNAIAGGEIRLGDPHIAHLTLTMGALRGNATLASIQQQTAAVVTQFTKFTLRTTRAYLAEPARNFVFLDVAPKREILSMKRAVYGALFGLLEVPWAGRPGNDPHITVGYIDRKQRDVAVALKDIRPTEGEITSVGISRMGPRGTCVGTLESILLKSY